MCVDKAKNKPYNSLLCGFHCNMLCLPFQADIDSDDWPSLADMQVNMEFFYREGMETIIFSFIGYTCINIVIRNKLFSI